MSGTTDTFDRQALLDELTVDEGKREKPYFDTMNLITIGIGRNLSGVGISDDEIQHLFNNDVQACVDLLDQHVAWWRDLAPNEQRVMINLTFNMGWTRFSAFGHFIDAMHEAAELRHQQNPDADALRRVLQAAGTQLQASRWWGQVGGRGPRIIERLMSSLPPESQPMV